MRRRSIGSALSVAVLAAALGACNSAVESTTQTEIALTPAPARESPGPPTTFRLVLRRLADRFELVTATPKRGTVTEVDLEAEREDLLDGDSELFAYLGRSGAGASLVSGFFVVERKAIAEFQDLRVEERVRRQEQPLDEPVVRVAIPYHPELVTVDFTAMSPDPEAPAEQWKGTSMGTVRIDREGYEEPNDDPS